MSKTLIVVPCFNEETRLPRQAFVDYAQAHPNVRFLMVNDGSSDGTAQLLDGLAAEHPRQFEALQLAKNGGKAEAVRQGFLHGIAQQPHQIGFWDADLATPLNAVDDFVAVMDAGAAVELVMGSRVQLLGRNIERHRGRHYFGRVAATAVSVMLDLPVYDTQCGAKLFRVNENLAIIFGEAFLTRWVFDVEILARWILLNQGAPRSELQRRIHEMPLRQWTDVKGSRLKPTDFARAPMELLKIRRHYFGKGPFKLF